MGFEELAEELDFIPKGLGAPGGLEAELRSRDALLVVMEGWAVKGESGGMGLVGRGPGERNCKYLTQSTGGGKEEGQSVGTAASWKGPNWARLFAYMLSRIVEGSSGQWHRVLKTNVMTLWFGICSF